jgi:hypothetical protein
MLLLAPHAYAPAEPEWRGLARAAVLSAAVKGEVRAFPEGRQHVEDDPQNHVRHIVNPQCHFRRTLDESSRNRRRVFAGTIPDLYGENFAALAGLEDHIASAI